MQSLGLLAREWDWPRTPDVHRLAQPEVGPARHATPPSHLVGRNTSGTYR